jgi:hypothetical protein
MFMVVQSFFTGKFNPREFDCKIISVPLIDLTAFLTLLSQPSQSIFTLMFTVCTPKIQLYT